MKSFIVRASQVALAVVMIVIGSTTASAQSISTFNGGSGSTETAQTGWTTGSNWSPVGVPSGTNVWALMNSQTAATLRIAYTSLPASLALSVGAISFQPTMKSTGTNVDFRNSSTNTTGTTRFYGIDTTINGVPRRIILDNQSSLNIGVSTGTTSGGSTFGQVYELFTSGAINVAADASLTLAPLIRDGDGTARSITKIGSGVLSFNRVSFGSVNNDNSSNSSTYSGGFILDGGIVQWALSGGSTASPFGVGPLTLRSGTLRSTTTSSRSINVNVVLDGSVEFGSAVAGFTGDVDVNSASGTRSTTILQDSVVSIAGTGTTAWFQATSGTGSLTKAGPGTLRFSGTSGALQHSGSTVVQAGRLIMNSNLASGSVVSVQSGANLFGTGTIAGATTILAGGTFSPGATSGAVGLFTFGSGGLTLAGQTLLEFSGTGTARGIDFDAVNLGGTIAYGGGLALALTGTTYADNTALQLFDVAGGASGSFSSVTASGLYGPLTFTNDGFGVWTSGETIVPGQTLTFTQATGVLSVVPEPSAVALGGLGIAAAGLGQWRRARHRRRDRRDAVAG